MSKSMLLVISIMVIAVIPLQSVAGETIEINGEKYTITPFEDVTKETIEIDGDKYAITPVKDHTEPKVTCANDKPSYHECHKLNGCYEHSHCDNHYHATHTPSLDLILFVLFFFIMMFTALIILRKL